jgi:hypothetical protein
MANKPDDPQRPKPEDQGLPPLDSDSAIDFSELNQEDMSGISVIEWASLVENPSRSAPDSSALQLPPGDSDDAIDLGGYSGEIAVGPGEPRDPISSDSSIDLGSSEVIDTANVPPDNVNLASAGEIDLDAVDLDDLQPAAGGSSGGPVLELGPDALVDSANMPRDDDEAIELDMDAIVAEGGHSGAGQSAIDLAGGLDDRSRGGGSSVSFDDDVLLEQVMGGSGGSGSGSSRDLIAEGLESGVHMPSSDEDDFLAHAKPTDEESSSVDLGSMHSLPMFDVNEDEGGQKPVDEDDAIDLTDPGLDMATPPPAKAKPKPKPKPAAAVAEEIEVVEEVAEVEPKPKKPAAAKAGGRGALVGGVVGMLGGAAAMFGAALMGVVPGVGGGGPAPKGPGPAPGPQQPVAVATFDRTMDQIRNGDLDKVDPADLDKAEDAKPEQLVARAEYHWLSYLKKERGANPAAPLRADAEEVKKALTDLDKAIASASPEAASDALFLRGQIHETVGNAAAARADYVAGAAKLPARKPQFDAAIQVMDLTTKVGRLAPGLEPRALALLLVAFQPPVGEVSPGAAAALPSEAGLSFWRAVLAAKENKFGEAVKLLDKARADHDQRRYLLPRKPQNPTSDPSERIFLRACDLLKEHWLLQSRLSNPNYLAAMAQDRVPQVDAILTKAGETAGATMLKDIAARVAKDKAVNSVEELVKLIDADRKTKDEKIAFLEKADEAQKKELTTLGDNLKAATTSLTQSRDALKTTAAGLKQAKADGDAAVAALKEVGAVTGSDFKDLKTSKDAVVSSVREAVKAAKTTDPKGSIRQLERDLAAARENLSQRWEPARMLTYWVPLIDAHRDRKDLAASALKDAERVQADPAAKEADKARALLVQGLALRNEEKYAEAVPALKKAAGGLDGDALRRAEAALSESANPAATVARRAAELEGEGKRKEALAVLERGLKTLPDPKGPLYVQRARLALAEARAKGTLTANDPLVAEARKDAGQARTAEGAYLLGRIAEELGSPVDAVAHYRNAVRAHNRDDEQGSRYRIALARALMRARPATAAPAPRPLPPTTRTGMLPLDLVGLMVVVTLQGPAGDPQSSAEAEKLADEILAMGDKAPFDVRAQALAIKGLHTRAVTTYVTGLRDKGKLPAEEANTLLSLVSDHPALRRPESKATPDPMLSERHYGSGLNFFYARKYADAEREFLSAIESDSSDARYYYYLGLSRLAQGKREAAEDFDQGARLEQAGRPDRAAVSAALERIQGRMRRELNDVRDRPTRDAK